MRHAPALLRAHLMSWGVLDSENMSLKAIIRAFQVLYKVCTLLVTHSDSFLLNAAVLSDVIAITSDSQVFFSAWSTKL